jgi:hypothetical protein
MRKHETALMSLIRNKILERFASANNYKSLTIQWLRREFDMIETEVYQYEDDEYFCN